MMRVVQAGSETVCLIKAHTTQREKQWKKKKLKRREEEIVGR